MRKSTKNAVWIGVLVAAILILIALVAKLYGVGDKKAANPDNLVSIDVIGAVDYAPNTGNTGYGVNVTVDDLGAIKMTGKATGDLDYEICEVTLTAGKMYTLTSEVNGQSIVTGANAAETGYALVLVDETTSAVYYADIQNNGTFTVPSGSASFTLHIYVLKDTNLGLAGKTFKPVLVEGKKAGSFTQ